MKLAVWALIAIYSFSRVLQVFPGPFPMVAVVALHVVPPAIFAWIHGATAYGWRAMLVFFAVCLAVGNVFENSGVRTGFPFGHYNFTGLMGPKVLDVPIMLGMAYVGMAYLAWTMARLILGDAGRPLSGSRIATVPLVAGFLMTAWDFSMDPVWSTILHAWVWRDGGSYFGVPVSNFLGWYFTVFCFYQLFALYLKGREVRRELAPGYWRTPVVFYAVSAAGNLLLAIPRPGPPVVSDAAGVVWRVSDITGACVLVSIFVMGAFALIAWVRSRERDYLTMGQSPVS
jgi:putative membrane protein